jgi:alkyl sulfatase BDS1-like metallo-beta-lactamase superfamily hydrolase
VTYRDAMQFQHDQAIRLINQGKSPDDLANAIVVPDYLTLDPYTIQTYGNTKTIVRSFFTGYVSWFDGNAANLDPLPKIEEDKRLVEAMGGRDQVFKLAEKALNDGEIKWAVALSDKLVRINNKDMQARHLKAAGFRHLGYATYNSTNRGFYLSGADELDGIIDLDTIAKAGRLFSMADGVVKGLPTAALMDTLRYKVLPEYVKGTDTGYYFNFTDTKEEFTVRLRNGILEVTEGEHPHDVSIKTDRKTFNQLFIDEVAPSIEKIGEVKGAKEDIARFDKAIDFTFYPTRLAVQ